LIRDVTAAMDGYDLQRSVRPFVSFIDDLTNWYIRRSRRRFWKSQDDADKRSAYSTLYRVLLDLSKVAAPFIPFLSESLYRRLRSSGMPDSVHLCDFPTYSESLRDEALEAQMRQTMQVVAMGRQLRAEHDLKIRQPLARLHVACRDANVLTDLRAMAEVLSDELNVKETVFSERTEGLATLRVKPNWPRLGPRLGPKVRAAAPALAALSQAESETLAGGGSLSVRMGEETVVIGPEDVEIEAVPLPGVVVAASGGIVVALETTLTPELVEEGLAREFINRVQNLRKTADLQVTQRIQLRVEAPENVRQALARHRATIQQETLCDVLEWSEGSNGETVDLNGHPCRIEMVPLG